MPTQTFKVGEMLNKRTLNSKTWINFDGSYTTEIYPSPVHFEDDSGNLHNINTDLFDEADFDNLDIVVNKHGKQSFIDARLKSNNAKTKNALDRDLFDYQGLQVPFECKIPKNYKRGYTIGKGADKLVFKPVKASPSKGYINGDPNIITYQDAWNDTDVSLELTNQGIKETITLKTDRAPSSFSFEVEGVIADDLTAGELKVKPAWMKDKNGTERDVPQTVKRDGNKVYIDITPDLSGLVYPVEIDPTVTIAQDSVNGKDVMVASDYPSSNLTWIAIGHDTSINRYGLFQFDLSSIPTGSAITNGIFDIFQKGLVSGTDSSVTDYSAHRIEASWVETSVTWNTKPPFSSTAEAVTSFNPYESVGNGVDRQWVITQLVKDWVSGSQTNYGVLIKDVSTVGHTLFPVETSEDANGHPPKLSVTYNVSPGAPTVMAPNGGETWNAQQIITWTAATDPDTAQSGLQYQIQLSTDNGSTWADIVALTTAGATSYGYDFSGAAETSTALIRIRAYDGASYSPWDQSDGVFTIQHNQAPTAPTNLSPSGGTPKDRAQVIRFSWLHNDPNAGDQQSKFDLQWRLQGAANWNTITQVTTNQYYDMPANALPHGNIEWQVRTYDQAGLSSPYSDIGVFLAGDKPANPTITYPTDGATVPVSNPTVQWSSDGQTGYDLKVLDINNTVLWESVKTSTNKAETVGIALSNTTDYKVSLAIKNADGLYSNFVTVNIHVSYTPPAVPTLAIDKGQAIITLNITHPAPVDPQPAVTSVDIYRRIAGETDWTRIATNLLDSFIDYTLASGEQYEYKVRAFGDNGTFIDSDVISTSIVFKGVWLFDAKDPSTIHQFRFDSDRSDNWDSNGSLMKFAGRRLPLAEFDDTESHSVAVSLKIKKEDNDLAVLSQLIRSKNTLCYRDGRGRKLFCQVFALPYKDEFYGNSLSLTFDEVSYEEAV